MNDESLRAAQERAASLEADFLSRLNSVQTEADLQTLRNFFLGKKGGVVPELMKLIPKFGLDSRPAFAAVLNTASRSIEHHLQERKAALEKGALQQRLGAERIDVTLPSGAQMFGKVHPITAVIEEVEAIFNELGFESVLGPSVESEWLNFTALNMPPDHPARQMQDSFYVHGKSERGDTAVLRTQTSPVQIRSLMELKAPLRVISAGRTYRRDHDATHSPMFHQIEGLCIEPGITFGHLKHLLGEFVSKFFGVNNVPMRFRPSYFPFTEPSAEVDIGCSRSATGIQIGEGSDWLEVLGCGMVHPHVFKNCGLEGENLQGFAFGVGVERLAMLKFGIPDLRIMFQSDVEWLSHYGRSPFRCHF
jgi:phenylalanyl-tRNA synthetase alpha chain